MISSTLSQPVAFEFFIATSVTPRPGGFAEYAILEQDLAIRVPEAVSLEDAATFSLCSLTAAQVIIYVP